MVMKEWQSKFLENIITQKNKNIKDNIQAGDKVKSKSRELLNGGLAFNVLEIDGDKALCDFLDSDKDQTNRQEYFELSDLIFVTSADGGFF